MFSGANSLQEAAQKVHLCPMLMELLVEKEEGPGPLSKSGCDLLPCDNFQTNTYNYYKLSSSSQFQQINGTLPMST